MCSTNSYIEFIYFFCWTKNPENGYHLYWLRFCHLYDCAHGNAATFGIYCCCYVFVCVCVCLQLFKFNGKTAVFAIIWVVNFRLGYKSIKRLTFGPTENCRQYVDLCSCGLFKYLHASNKLLIWLLRRTQFVHYIVC